MSSNRCMTKSGKILKEMGHSFPSKREKPRELSAYKQKPSDIPIFDDKPQLSVLVAVDSRSINFVYFSNLLSLVAMTLINEGW